MKVKRIHNQVDRIASTAVDRQIVLAGQQRKVELHELSNAIDKGFERWISELRQLIEFRSSAPYGESVAAVLPDDGVRVTLNRCQAPELTWLAEQMGSLAGLLDEDLPAFPADDRQIEELPHPTLHGSNAFLGRFAVRHTIALVLAFLLGLWDNQPALHGAIWLLMIGGPPSHGATLRKFTIRAIGSSGALALAALGTTIVSPNYSSLAPYMTVIFAGTLATAYIAEGGGILSYLAIGGTAFAIAYSGPGPRYDVLSSIWSVWGISVGMTIRAGLSLVLREHAYRTLAEEFQAPLAAVLELARGSERVSNQSTRPSAEMTVIGSIQMMLGVANDAQLEGRSAGIDPNRLVDALDTLLRLATVLANANRAAIAGGEPSVSPSVMNALCRRLETWLEKLRDENDLGIVSRAPLRRMVDEAVVSALDAIPGTGHAPLAPASTGTELDRRIIDLTQTLERQLREISLS
jgi:hypothetical protein